MGDSTHRLQSAGAPRVPGTQQTTLCCRRPCGSEEQWERNPPHSLLRSPSLPPVLPSDSSSRRSEGHLSPNRAPPPSGRWGAHSAHAAKGGLAVHGGRWRCPRSARGFHSGRIGALLSRSIHSTPSHSGNRAPGPTSARSPHLASDRCGQAIRGPSLQPSATGRGQTQRSVPLVAQHGRRSAVTLGSGHQALVGSLLCRLLSRIQGQ